MSTTPFGTHAPADAMRNAVGPDPHGKPGDMVWEALCAAFEDRPGWRQAVARAVREYPVSREAALLDALKEARQWVEANTAQVRGLSSQAAAPGEAMLARIDALLTEVKP